MTHDKQADDIEFYSSKGFAFESKAKKGKKYAWDGSPIGETYVAIYSDDESDDDNSEDESGDDDDGDVTISDEPTDNSKYKKVWDHERVLPGSYSWWGISLQEWYDDASDSTARRFQQKLKFEFEEVSGYLKSPPASPYGNNEFTGKLADVLECYRKSRGVADSDVYLVIGGTLRYKHEICYVVIVCTRKDTTRKLKDFPPLNARNQDVIELNGLVDEKGKFVNPDAVPEFKLRHITKHINWESLAFAFYFSTSDELQCSSDMIKRLEIRHGEPHENCTSKQPLPYGQRGSWNCPNVYYNSRVKSKSKRQRLALIDIESDSSD